MKKNVPIINAGTCGKLRLEDTGVFLLDENSVVEPGSKEPHTYVHTASIDESESCESKVRLSFHSTVKFRNKRFLTEDELKPEDKTFNAKVQLIDCDPHSGGCNCGAWMRHAIVYLKFCQQQLQTIRDLQLC